MAILASLRMDVFTPARNYGEVILRTSVVGTPEILLDIDIVVGIPVNPVPPPTLVPVGNDGVLAVPVQCITLALNIGTIGILMQDDLITWQIQHSLLDGTAWTWIGSLDPSLSCHSHCPWRNRGTSALG